MKNTAIWRLWIVAERSEPAFESDIAFPILLLARFWAHTPRLQINQKETSWA
jgi:hypothetical protein